MTPTNTPLTLQNNISLAEAKSFTHSWRHSGTSIKYSHVGFVKAFNINKSDIDQLQMLIPHNGSCRAYLAISPESTAVKLLMVPVNGDGLDILSIENDGDEADESQSTIFDFTTPCPSQCDTSSPLYGDDHES